jgi:hypothetical protein
MSIMLSSGYQAIFLEVGVREADHSLPSSAEVKMVDLYIHYPLPHMPLHSA